MKTDTLRCVDYAIAPGVEADMGDGDEWPKIRDRVLGPDILLLSTPIWLGHPSSVTQRVLERLDTELSNTDDEGRPIMYGKVALVSVVGNEDGAHKVFADCAQGLNDIGFSFAGLRRAQCRTPRRSATSRAIPAPAVMSDSAS